jgi:hypothetical protein
MRDSSSPRSSVLGGRKGKGKKREKKQRKKRKKKTKHGLLGAE